MWRCRNCGRRFGWERVHPACEVCGGPLDRERPIEFHPQEEKPDAPGLWRYRAALGLPPQGPMVSLGEGRTPLQPVQVEGHRVYVKREDQNPTGSVKDRAAAVLFAWARGQGVKEVVTLATPNTLRAWKQYARATGIRVRAYVARDVLPVRTSRWTVRSLPGTLSEVLVQLHHEEITVLAPYHPLAVDAYATIAYEIVAQLGGRAPGTVIAPVGQGSLLLGLGRGFLALYQAGVIDQVPCLVGVEPLARAGLWALSKGGRETHLWVREEAPVPTLEAGRRFPWWGDLLLTLVAWSQGRFLAVDEEAWLRARDAFRRVGLYLQPESALVWAGWAAHKEAWTEPVVLILPGGHGSFWHRIRQKVQRWMSLA